ncbi:MAG: methyltransferase domain-containing protein [Acidobacteriia bacterium]|nr:methyltransferase domain-containing protein [Terriglobia bacterium]
MRIPTPLLVETASKLKPGRALDLACGAGRNAIWLAEHGWEVTAVDRSPVSIPMVDTHVADLEKHEFTILEAAWDLIVVCYYLQRDLFEPIKRGVKPGGIALAIVHMFEPGHEQSRFSVQPGELATYFEDWEILHYYEGKPRDPEHKRAVAEIVAKNLRTSAT